MAFSDEVKKYGSVEAALAAKGYTNNGSTWVKSDSVVAAKPAATTKQTESSAVTSMSKRDADNATLSQPGGSIRYTAADGTTGTLKNMGQSWEPGVDYSQRAYDAAEEQYAKYGYVDRDYIDDLLMRRQDKMDATGSDGGGVSNQTIWNDIMSKYSGAIGPGKNAVSTNISGQQNTLAATQELQNSIAQQLQKSSYPQYGTMQEFGAAMGYDQGEQAIRDAVAAAVEQAVLGFNDQIDYTKQSASDAARQAYIAKMLGEKNIDQQMANSGYAGGLSDSHRIAQEAAYQNELSEILRSRDDAVKELESAIVNARLTGDLQTAQQLQAQLQQLQGAWQSYLSDMTARNDQNAQFLAQMEYQQNAADYARGEEQRQAAWDRAMTLIANGVMPDTATLQAAELTQEAVNALLGGTSADTPAYTPQPLRQNYDNGGLEQEQVRQLQTALGVTADGLWGANSAAAAGGMTAKQVWDLFDSLETTTAKNLLANYMRTGGGLTQARQLDLDYAASNGQITDNDLSIILDQIT